MKTQTLQIWLLPAQTPHIPNLEISNFGPERGASDIYLKKIRKIKYFYSTQKLQINQSEEVSFDYKYIRIWLLR